MAIKWLDAKRLQGTNAERLALTSGVSTANCLGLWTFQEQTGDVINIATTGNGFADGLGSSADGTVDGTIVRNAKARILRDDEEIASGEINSLKHLKDDVKEIREGFECGIGVDNFSKFKEGDIIVCYEIKSIKRTLELN